VSAARTAGAAAEALLLLALLAAPWPYGGAPDAARYLLAAAALAAGAAWALSRALEGEGLPLATAAALGLPAVALVQVLSGRSVAPARTRDALLLLTAFASALAVFLGRTRERAAAVRVAGALVGVCLAQAAFALAQWSLGAGRLYGRVSEEVTAPFGSFVNHNHFAALMETGVLLCAGLAWGVYRRAERATPAVLALSGLALALAAAQLASGSRGGLIAVLAGALCLVALRLFGPGRPAAPGARAGLSVLVGLGLAAALALALVSPQARTRLGSLARGRSDRSGAYRLDTARATLAAAAHRPLLGSGFGAFEDALPPFKRRHGDVRTTHAESDALEVLAEGGLLGLLALGALAAVCARALAARLRYRRERTRRWLALSAAAAAAAVLVHAVLDFGLRLPAVALALAAVLGLAAAPREERARGGAAASGLLAAVFAAAAVAALVRAQGALALDRAGALADARLRAAALADVLAVHPGLADGHRARALALAATAAGDRSGQRLARAGRELADALRGRPQWSAAWADLAWVREAAGDAAGARSSLDQAAALDPASAGIGLARAAFLVRQGERDAAVTEMGRLWAHNPGWTRPEVEAAARRQTGDVSFLEGVSRLTGP